jgi:rRNA maturation endonuclease Nob1
MDEPLPRNLPERTGRHRCIRCLAEVAEEEYFANDQVCDECGERFARELAPPSEADDE